MVDGTRRRLSHAERLAVLRDHGDFFAALDRDALDAPVAACPEWTVEDVLRHVAGGAAAVQELCSIGDMEDADPSGPIRAHMKRAKDTPVHELGPLITSYVDSVSALPKGAGAYLHLGRSTVETQVWHVTGDWGVHRHDVEVALGLTPSLSTERAIDLLLWFVDYLIPTVERLRSLDQLPNIRLVSEAHDFAYQREVEDPAATVTGSPTDMLLRLFRRPHGPVSIHGDPLAELAYVSLPI